MISRWKRVRVKHVIAAILILFVLDFFGAFTHIFEQDFYEDFRYPLEGDIAHYVHQVRQGHASDVPPLNTYNSTMNYNPRQKCRDEQFELNPQIVFLVKSAMNHFKRRNAIRSSWGHERRFSDVLIRTVFLVGVASPSSDEPASQYQNLIDIEANNFADIVQSNFVDSYYNNTLKTMSGIRWAVENCPSARFYMFVDDDYFVSTKNVLRYLRNPVQYPDYIEEADEIIRQLARKLAENKNSQNFTESQQMREIESVLEKQSADGHRSVDSRKFMAVIQSRYEELRTAKSKVVKREEQQQETNNSQRKLLAKELPLDVKLFSGFVINSAPHRHKTSKWHISLEEYPYHMWPTYISAGSYILSREALIQMYYTSWFTKTFRFDDIYLALVALKADVKPLHSEEFHFQKAMYTGPHSYRYVIASHGYHDADELVRVWSEVRAAGHA